MKYIFLFPIIQVPLKLNYLTNDIINNDFNVTLFYKNKFSELICYIIHFYSIKIFFYTLDNF